MKKVLLYFVKIPRFAKKSVYKEIKLMQNFLLPMQISYSSLVARIVYTLLQKPPYYKMNKFFYQFNRINRKNSIF